MTLETLQETNDGYINEGKICWVKNFTQFSIIILQNGAIRLCLERDLANEDSLLRTHCCSWCFLGCANWETFFADTKRFWTKLETLFVSRTQILCPQQMLRARANGETFVSATMCPQQCVCVCQGLKQSDWLLNREEGSQKSGREKDRQRNSYADKNRETDRWAERRVGGWVDRQTFFMFGNSYNTTCCDGTCKVSDQVK